MSAAPRFYVVFILQSDSSRLNPAQFKEYVLNYCREHAQSFEERDPVDNPSIAEVSRVGPPCQLLVYAYVHPFAGKSFTERLHDGLHFDQEIDEIVVRRREQAFRGGSISLQGVFQR